MARPGPARAAWLALMAAGLAAVLLAPRAARAAELRPLSEDEMSSVHGQGLSAGTLQALSGAAVTGPSADALEQSLRALQGSGLDANRNLDKQLAQQQQQLASTGLQTSLQIAKTMAAVSQFGALPALTLPVLGLPLFFLPVLGALPTLPTPPSKNGKVGG